jgi:hypothetical protein
MDAQAGVGDACPVLSPTLLSGERLAALIARITRDRAMALCNAGTRTSIGGTMHATRECR